MTSKPSEAPKGIDVKDETPAPEAVKVKSPKEDAPVTSKPSEAPKGIDWFSEVTGETVYTTRSAAIKAFINSSNWSPNAHAGQDRGWKLGPIWVEKVENALTDPNLAPIVEKFSDDETGEVNYPGLIMALWGREVKMAKRKAAGTSQRPFADKYRQITSKN